MVYIFRVVSCFSCKFFQVDQVKKSTNKWSCKLCGQKQSLKQTYFQGSSKECRQQVQKLNISKGQKEESSGNNYVESYYNGCLEAFDTDKENVGKQDVTVDKNATHKAGESSKWSLFLEEPDSLSADESDSNDTASLDSFTAKSHCRRTSGKRGIPSRFKKETFKPYSRNNSRKSFVSRAKTPPAPSFRVSQQENFAKDKEEHKYSIFYDYNGEPDDIFCIPNLTKTVTSITQNEPANNTVKKVEHLKPPSSDSSSKWSVFLCDEESDYEEQL